MNSYLEVGMWLVTIAGRSIGLLMTVAVIAIFCRRASAAVQHFIYLTGLLACLTLPLISLLPLPEMPVACLPPSDAQPQLPAEVRYSVDQVVNALEPQTFEPRRLSETSPSSSTNTKSSSLASQTDAAPSLATNDGATAVAAAPPAPVAPVGWPGRDTWHLWLLAMWLLVSLLLGIRWLVQTLAVARWLQRCRSGDQWQHQVSQCALQMGVTGAVSCKVHAEDVSPMVVGLVRPVIVLPQLAVDWTSERRRMVLLHELAHIKRRDLLKQSLASLVCALYWFNPLAWWFAYEMRRLRELACDDLVVVQTSQAGQYAEVLLGIAKEYRGRCWASGIAMARSNAVASRIRCILDAARRRKPLSKHSAGLSALSLLVLAVLISTLALRSRVLATEQPLALENESAEVVAEAPQKASDEKGDGKSDSAKPETRELKVRVRDAEGNELAGAEVAVSVWELRDTQNFPHRELKTDAEGQVTVPIPKKLRILRVWARMPDRVPMFMGFETNKHDEGAGIPERLSFKLPLGNKLSGYIVDPDGKPVKGAKVAVKLEVPFRPAPPMASPDNWLAEGDAAAETDENGQWKITTAPAKSGDSDFEFQLYVQHPELVGDTHWGELQKSQGITASQLRDGTAKLKLKRGLEITGQVTDERGKPIAQGLVVWSDQPYFSEGVNEAEIESDGRFKSIRLAPGKYPVTILAPGYAPEQKTIDLSPGSSEVNFQLKPGRPIKIKILDSAGQPIKGKVYVGIQKWRNAKAIYNNVHPNVLTSRIPSGVGPDGTYVWQWAPEDAIEYSFYSEGYDIVQATLVPTAEPHEIRLVRPPIIFGKVVDIQTGKPISKFRAVTVKAFSPDWYSTDFQGSGVTIGKDGQYSLKINTHGQAGHRYRVRIEADGYRTAFGTKDLAAGDPAVEEDFRLEPKPAWIGKVVDHKGQPVMDFSVAVGTPTVVTDFEPERLDNSFDIGMHVEGRNDFQLAATFEPMRIRVFNDHGFAEVLRGPDEPIGTIQLQPWSKVKGRLFQGDKAIANAPIYLFPLAEPELTEARFQDNISTQTDSNGNFSIDKLPAASGSIGAYLGPWQDSELTSSEFIPVQPAPGKALEVILGKGGVTIEGRVKATGRSNDEFSKQWSINYLIRRDDERARKADVSTFTFDDQGPLQLQWTRSPDFQKWLKLHQYHYVKLDSEGRVLIHGVDPGQYDLLIQLYEQPAGCLVETVGQVVLPVSVKAEPAGKNRLSLGDIDVPCRIGPRVGSDMRVYRFTDAKGVVRQVDDYQGSYVLLQVWASWCAPCRESFPSIRAVLSKYPPRDLTIIGLNVDEDQVAAKALADRENMNWAQNYLGAQSELARQLAISSVPAYYLIDPDGKLAGSYTSWQEVQSELSKRLPAP